MSKRLDLAKVIANKRGGNTKLLAREVAAYLLETNQVGQLESLMRDVKAEREANGHIEADVSVAHDLDKDILAEVRSLLKHAKPGAKSVTAEVTQDPSIIGGLKVRLAHEQLDMSVRSKLDTFKRLTSEGVN